MWQTLPSLHTTAVPPQEPPAQTSLLVHALPSLQTIVLLVNTQPVPALQLSVVHVLPSLQVMVAPGTQALAAHTSPTVQTLPSLHGAVLAVCAQPVTALQVSSVQTLPSSQFWDAPGTQLPPDQVSLTVHTLPSLHGEVLFTCWQPATASHASVVQGLPSSQFSAGPETHAPDEQTSPTVHTLLSVHGMVLLVNVQPLAARQLSEVQTLLSLQVITAPDWQLPPEQMSPLVQALLSVQAVVKLVWRQPAVASQLSPVHGLLSSQLSVVAPDWHALAAQMSPTVQALLSVQALVLGV